MRTIAITNRIFKELLRDRRTLALLLFGPIFIMWLLSIMFSANLTTDVKIGTYDVDHAIVKNLKDIKHVTVKQYSSQNQAKKALRNYQVDSIIIKQNHEYDVAHANIDSSKTALAKKAIQAALQLQQSKDVQKTIQKLTANLPMSGIASSSSTAKTPKIHTTYQYGNADTNFFNKVTPLLMGFFIFFFIFLISGIGLLRERSSGTLERLLATPVRRGEIVGGYMLGYGAVAIVQTIVIVATTLWLLKIQVVGSLTLVFLINLLLAFAALAIGIFISTFANSEFQMMQFIPIVVLPQIFFCGLVPLSNLPGWTVYFSKILPLTYASDALSDVVLKGASLIDILPDLLGLIIFIVLFIALNIWGLRRYRKA